jgi:hypothetical protein
MISMRNILFIVALSFFYSCVSGQKEDRQVVVQECEVFEEEITDYISELEQSFVGEWINVSMRVWVRTYNQSDTSFIVDINEDNWDLKMTVKPIATTVYADGTYTSEFRNSFDSLIYRPKGTWMIDGDSLIMEDHQAVYKYQIFIDGDLAEFKSIVDWDNDGQVDDEYFGVQRKTQ